MVMLLDWFHQKSLCSKFVVHMLTFSCVFLNRFGSKYRSNVTGIIYNNEMADFDIPGWNIVDDISPSPVNYPEPRKRPFSSMSPAILTNKSGDVQLIIGASGGKRITTAVSLVRPTQASETMFILCRFWLLLLLFILVLFLIFPVLLLLLRFFLVLLLLFLLLFLLLLLLLLISYPLSLTPPENCCWTTWM